MRAIRVALAVLLMCAATGCSPGFSEAHIEDMKKSIKKEFEKREGVTVVEVVMLKENSKRAVGFVKLKIPLFGEITKACSATMAENTQYIWRCE